MVTPDEVSQLEEDYNIYITLTGLILYSCDTSGIYFSDLSSI